MRNSLRMKATTSTPARSGQSEASAARELLEMLFDLSNRQGDALNREDYSALEGLLTEKSDLLTKFQEAVNSLREMGWDLNNPTTYPKDSAVAATLREASDISRKLQAHERYVLGQMIVQRQLAGDRMDAILQKRMAVTGYSISRERGGIFDAAS